jgi:hypothetical protein
MIIERRGDQFAIIPVAPAVIRTDEIGGAAGIPSAQLGAPVPATVQQGSNLAVICADNDNRGASQPSGDIITRRGNFAFVTEVNPAAIEYLVEFSAVDIVAGKGFASDKSVFGVNEATGWRWTHDQTCLSL